MNISGRGYTFIAEVVSRGESGASLAGSFGETERTAEKIIVLPTNLPQNLPPIFGRTTELDALQDLIGQQRLVTLAGMGGIGKTRLAIELGLLLAPGLPGGAWLVDPAPLTMDVTEMYGYNRVRQLLFGRLSAAEIQSYEMKVLAGRMMKPQVLQCHV